jgi:hypothetical protein
MTSTDLDHNDHNDKLAVEEKEKLEWVTPSVKNQMLRPPDHNKKPSVARDPREDQNSSTAENNENDTPNTASRPWFAP